MQQDRDPWHPPDRNARCTSYEYRMTTEGLAPKHHIKLCGLPNIGRGQHSKQPAIFVQHSPDSVRDELAARGNVENGTTGSFSSHWMNQPLGTWSSWPWGRQYGKAAVAFTAAAARAVATFERVDGGGGDG